jgi:hypothetical protein
MRIATDLSLAVSILFGAIAALSSQVTAFDYFALFIQVVVETGLCLLCGAFFVFRARGLDRWVVAPTALLAVAGCVELGARLIGVRLLG